LVDEVLAVGDLAFRNKALERMHQLAHSGVAVVFVSHSLSQVDRLCSHALYLKKGRFIDYGPTAQVIHRYVGENLAGESGMVHHPGTEAAFLVREVTFRDRAGLAVTRIESGSFVAIRAVIEVMQPLARPLFCFMIEPKGHAVILAYIHQPRSEEARPSLAPGRQVVEAAVERLPFLPGRYDLRLSVAGAIESQLLGKVTHLASLDVLPRPDQYIITNEAGLMELEAAWRFQPDF
ncbi:MAG: hypothetical protein H7839_23615, partial [Magnetococcus sp. YQC-5]